MTRYCVAIHIEDHDVAHVEAGSPQEAKEKALAAIKKAGGGYKWVATDVWEDKGFK